VVSGFATGAICYTRTDLIDFGPQQGDGNLLARRVHLAGTRDIKFIAKNRIFC